MWLVGPILDRAGLDLFYLLSTALQHTHNCICTGRKHAALCSPFASVFLILVFKPVIFFSVLLGVQDKAFSWLVLTGDHSVFH